MSPILEHFLHFSRLAAEEQLLRLVGALPEVRLDGELLEKLFPIGFVALLDQCLCPFIFGNQRLVPLLLFDDILLPVFLKLLREQVR